MYIKKKNNTVLTVETETTLLPFLMSRYSGSRTAAKSLLAHRLVMVNGRIETRFDSFLRNGDKVTVICSRGNMELKHPKLRLVYEDDFLLVVEKKPGLLTVPTHVGGTETTVMSILKAYVRKQNPRNSVYVVHRLDRETSGLLVVAKSADLQQYMRTYWKDLVTLRVYVAVAEGAFREKEGQIRSWFTEDKRNAMVYSSLTDNGGDLAITNYKVLQTGALAPIFSGAASGQPAQQLSLVELKLETGRTNQIRVHLASGNHPVLGDRKYGHGNLFSPTDRLCLHARILEFIHPAKEQKIHFETPVPKEFLKLFISKEKKENEV